MSFTQKKYTELDLEVTDASRQNAFNELIGLYKNLDGEMKAVVAECNACGNCCRFQEFGHDLFVTPLEADFLIRSTPLDSENNDSMRVCSWLIGNRCLAWESRTLGCRISFCSDNGQEARSVLYEKYLLEIKGINFKAGYSVVYALFGSVVAGIGK